MTTLQAIAQRFGLTTIQVATVSVIVNRHGPLMRPQLLAALSALDDVRQAIERMTSADVADLTLSIDLEQLPGQHLHG